MSTIMSPRTAPRNRPHPPRSGPNPAAATAGTSIDPFRVMRRHLGLIIGSVIVGAVLGVGAWLALRQFYPLYSSNVLFKATPGLEGSSDLGTKAEFVNADAALRATRTELEIFLDRDVIETAVSNPEVLKTRWIRKFADDGGQINLLDAADELEEDLRPDLPRDTNLFGIAWTAKEPKDLPIVLDAMAQAFVQKRQRQDDRVFEENRGVFERQLEDSKRSIDDLTLEIEQFIRDKGITSLTDPRYHQVALALTELIERRGEAETALTQTQQAYLITSEKLQGTVSPTAEDEMEAKSDPVVRQQELRVTELKSELNRLLERYHPTHPSLTTIQSRLRAVEEEYRAKVDEIISRNLTALLKQYSNQIQQLSAVIQEIETEYEERDAQLRELAADFSRYQELEEERELLQVRRDTELELIKELQLMRLRKDASRVSLAIPPVEPREPSFPQPEIVIPLTTFLCVALVVGIIFLRELTDQRVKSASDLAIVPGARVLGVIPDLEDDPTNTNAAELVIEKHPQSVLAESYRQACSPIVDSIDRGGHQTILFVGGLPGAGTSTAGTNLAATLSASGRRVVVVDANFRRPHLADIFGVPSDSIGLGDLLHNATSLPEAIQSTASGIDFVPAGTPGNRVFERLSDERLSHVLAELRDRYDVVIIDSPPAIVAVDAMVLANRVDATVLVVRAGQEQRGLVARLIGQLSECNSDLIGVMLNRARGTAGGYFKKNFATMAEYAASSNR